MLKDFLTQYEDDFEEIGYFIRKMEERYPRGMKNFDKVLDTHSMWDIVDAAYAFYSMEVSKEQYSPGDTTKMRSVISTIEFYD